MVPAENDARVDSCAATNTHSNEMVGRGSQLSKQPCVRRIVESGVDSQARRPTRLEREPTELERNRQSQAACLDVALFERPVLEEAPRSFAHGQGMQRASFSRCEKSLGHLDWRGPRERFDVDANVQSMGYGADDEAVSVGQIEAQWGPRPRDLRATVRCCDEGPLLGRDRRVAGKYLANERARREEHQAVAGKSESSQPLEFVFGQ